MSDKPVLFAIDLEGCLVPEIWIGVAEKTGIAELSLTTRDISDYDELMRGRLKIMAAHGLKLADIQAVIASLGPLPGAVDFVQYVRERFPFVILSDTFYEFAEPLMKQLGRPTLLCHTLHIEDDGRITGYRLRAADAKRGAVRGFQENGFFVIAAGDSYNDVTMLAQADRGILFHAPANVVAEYAQFPSCGDYALLEETIENFAREASTMP